MKSWIPEKIINNIHEIDLLSLHKEGIEYLLLDVDNTLVSLQQQKIIEGSECFLQECQKLGIEVILLSNNFVWKVAPFAEKLALKYYAFAMKPFPFVYWRFLKEKAVKKEKVLAIGDQIFTDVWGAQSRGIRCYFLQNQKEKDRFSTRVLRYFERRILKNGK